MVCSCFMSDFQLRDFLFTLLKEELDHAITASGVEMGPSVCPDVSINTRSTGGVASTVSPVGACGYWKDIESQGSKTHHYHLYFRKRQGQKQINKLFWCFSIVDLIRVWIKFFPVLVLLLLRFKTPFLYILLWCSFAFLFLIRSLVPGQQHNYNNIIGIISTCVLELFWDWKMVALRIFSNKQCFEFMYLQHWSCLLQ